MTVQRIEGRSELEKKRVAAYARVSTEAWEQAESFAAQSEHYENFIKSEPIWEYAGLYADKGRSGTSAERRAGFLRMISDAKAGLMDIILVKSISRFARNVLDAQRYVRELASCGVEVRFEREGISSLDPSSGMVFSVLAAVAQEESRMISENVKWSYRFHAEKGIRRLGNNRVLGYDTDGSGKLTPNGEAWIVRLIFEKYASGEPVSGIIKALSDSGANRLRSGKPFTPSALKSILANEIYAGDRMIQKAAPIDYLTKKPDMTKPYTSCFIKDDHEAVISRATWERARARAERRS